MSRWLGSAAGALRFGAKQSNCDEQQGTSSETAQPGPDRSHTDPAASSAGPCAVTTHYKTWKILRDCRRKGEGVYYATTAGELVRVFGLTGQTGYSGHCLYRIVTPNVVSVSRWVTLPIEREGPVSHPQPNDPDPQGTFDRACFPGKGVTVFLNRCDNQDQIKLFSIADGAGNVYAYNNGANYAYVCAYLGSSITISANGLVTKKHTFTQQDLNDRIINICLDPAPTPTTHSNCPVGVAVTGLASGGRELPALSDLKVLELLLMSSPVGRKLVELYENPDLRTRATEAIQGDSELLRATLNLILIGSGVSQALAVRVERGQFIPLGGDPDCTDVIVTKEIAGEVERWATRLVDRAGDDFQGPVSQFQALVNGLVGASRRQAIQLLTTPSQ